MQGRGAAGPRQQQQQQQQQQQHEEDSDSDDELYESPGLRSVREGRTARLGAALASSTRARGV
jgi:hypothetical protein